MSCTSITKTVTRRSALSEALSPDMAGVRPLKAEMMETIAARATKLPELACPLQWAQESNKFDCVSDYLSSDGMESVSQTENS